MSKPGSKVLTGVKYVYLVVFFALAAGLFFPLINQSSFDDVIIGVIILFVGLAGGVLVFKAATLESRREIFLAGGFALIAISLFYIFQLTGRF
ncbi:MAG: conserved membrane protein of unknown function [Nitrosopumilales archaeon]|nr:MAG: conserved membrane protein of unknown function [Nitrosopumilales archaeon]